MPPRMRRSIVPALNPRVRLCPGAGVKWCQSPLPMANPKITKAAMAANFAQVARFCRIVPQRNPTTLIQVTTKIAISATTWARVRTIPAAEKTTCSWEIAGNNSAQIRRRSHRERGDRAAISHAEQHPAIEKCGQVAIRFAQINVLAAGVGKHRAQFGKGDASHREMPAPRTQTSRNSMGCGSGPAISFAVRKIEEPMMPPHSSRTESSRLSPRTRLGDSDFAVEGGETEGRLISGYPIPSSSGDSSGVPQRRQMTAEQSPQVSGSVTSWLHRGQ